MKITTSQNSLAASGWLGNNFRATASELTDVRVLAGAERFPTGFMNRLKIGLKLKKPAIKLRAVILWADVRGTTLDAYYDKGFDAAVFWLKEHGWDMDAAIADALKTPFVRIPVRRKN